jgi:hypothetical protein
MSNESESTLDVERMISEERSIREIGYARYWNREAVKLVGKKIVEARYLTQQDLENMGIDWWHRSTVVLFLDDGTFVLASSDDEMNSSGVLKAYKQDGTEIVMPHIPLD